MSGVMPVIKSADSYCMIEGTDIMGLTLFNIGFLYTGLNEPF